MGWVDGPSLGAVGVRLRERGRRLELDAALWITRELLDGLAHAHAGDRERPPVVHRDINPRNVLLDRSGRVQIVDFGIAKPADAEVAARMGSVGYMAPEQARGEPADPRADVFAVGCVLYELLTNERAFTDDGVWAPPSLAGVPESARPLLERALALDPDQRFADADAFLRALGPVLLDHAPSFGARDLAAILAELFRAGWEPSPTGPGDHTPATRVGADASAGAVQTFATRVTPLPLAPAAPVAPAIHSTAPRSASVGGADPANGTPTATRGRWVPIVLLLAIVAAGSGGVWSATHDSAATHDPSPTGVREPAPLAARPGPTPTPLEPEPEPALVDGEPTPARAPSLTIEIEPASAKLFVDDVLLDGPPYALPSPLAADTRIRVEHPEYRPQTFTLEPSSALDDAIHIELEPLGEGSISVIAPSVAWAEVWLDGTKLGTTPLTGKAVREGKHKLEVRCTKAVCDAPTTLLEQSIRVRAGRSLELRAAPSG